MAGGTGASEVERQRSRELGWRRGREARSGRKAGSEHRGRRTTERQRGTLLERGDGMGASERPGGTEIEWRVDAL